MKALFYLQFALLLGWSVSADAKHVGGDPCQIMEMYINTKLTPLVLEHGKKVMHRTYDDRGRLIKLSASLPLTAKQKDEGKEVWEGTPVETLEINWHTMEWKRTYYKAGKAAKTVTQLYNNTERLVEEIAVWKEGKHIYKEVSKFEFLEELITKYKFEEAQWKEVSKRSLPSLFTEKDNEGLGSYVQCFERWSTRRGETLDRLQCSEAIKDAIDVGGMQFPQYTKMLCGDQDTLYFPNGFRLDKKSCFGHIEGKKKLELRKEFEKAFDIITMMGTDEAPGMMRCLDHVNPELAANVASTLQEYPKIQCAGNVKINKDEVVDLFCPGTSKAAERCTLKLEETMQHSGGFFEGSQPHKIFLTGHDPSGNLKHAVKDKIERPKILASTILHELMHASGYGKKEEHNKGDLGDEVYGCQALCGGSQGGLFATREGCMKCLTAEERNNPPAEMVRVCKLLPKYHLIKSLEELEALSDARVLCYQERVCSTQKDMWPLCKKIKIPSPDRPGKCTDFEKTAGYSKVCKNLKPDSQECHDKMRLHLSKAIADQLKKNGPEMVTRAMSIMDGTFAFDGSKDKNHNWQFPIAGTVYIEGKAPGDRINAIVVDAFCSEFRQIKKPSPEKLIRLRAKYNKLSKYIPQGVPPITLRLDMGEDSWGGRKMRNRSQPILNKDDPLDYSKKSALRKTALFCSIVQNYVSTEQLNPRDELPL